MDFNRLINVYRNSPSCIRKRIRSYFGMAALFGVIFTVAICIGISERAFLCLGIVIIAILLGLAFCSWRGLAEHGFKFYAGICVADEKGKNAKGRYSIIECEDKLLKIITGRSSARISEGQAIVLFAPYNAKERESEDGYVIISDIYGFEIAQEVEL